MIGILFFGVIIGYIFLVKFAVTKIYEYTGEKIVRNIALAIFLLIPTWDIIIGYPIYKVLCWTNAGVHIYKTVDDVEGFYVGKRDSKFEPHEPYEGYKYIDYKEMNHYKPTGKYYRSYWINSNTSKDCVKPRYPDSPNRKYTKAFKSGKCIVKKEISVSELSQWEYDLSKNINKNVVPIVGISMYIVVIKDKINNKIIAKNISYRLSNNWFLGFLRNITISKGKWASCGGKKSMLNETLKIKKEER